jgi:hypothetical protein
MMAGKCGFLANLLAEFCPYVCSGLGDVKCGQSV